VLGIWWPRTESLPGPEILADIQARGIDPLPPLSVGPDEANSAVREAVAGHGAFPDRWAATALVYLAATRAEARLRRASA
jgi:hypothetical protein